MKIFKVPSFLKKFFSSSAIYFFGAGVNRAVPFFLLPVLTRWLTTADYGFIGTFYAVRNNIQPAIGMATSGAVNRAYIDRSKSGFDFPAYIFNALVVNLLLFALVFFLFLPFKGWIGEELHFPSSWLFFVFGVSLFSAFSNYKVDLWVYQDRPWAFGFSQILLSFLNGLLSILFLKFLWLDWRGRIVGIFVTELLFCFLTLFLLLKEDKVRFRIRKDYIKSVLAFGLPLYPHSLGLMMIAVSDKFFLNALLGLDVLGVYTVGYTFSTILIVLITPFDTAAAPRLYSMLEKNEEQQKEKFVCLFAVYFFVFAFLSVCLSTVVPYVFHFFVGDKFYGAEKYMFWIIMGQFSLMMYRIPSKWLNFARKNYHFTWITFSSGLVAVVANYVLIKLFGAVGAAYATFLAYTTMFVLTSIVAQKLRPMPWRALFQSHVWKNLMALEHSVVG